MKKVYQSGEPQRPLSDTLVGAHVSVAGGVETCFARAEALGCDAIQIFVKNASQWRAPRLKRASIEAFHTQRNGSRVHFVAAHASYLINLAAASAPVRERSVAALRVELERCEALGVDALVLHPGAHLDYGVNAGIERIVRSLDRVLGGTTRHTRLLLENTAGQGTYLGADLEHLSEILARSDRPRQIGVCIDTCHAFAAGLLCEGAPRFLTAVDDALGLDRVGLLHFNDSKQPAGSRKDRHANLGRGLMGERLLAELAGCAELLAVPRIVETPIGPGAAGHRRDIELLRAWQASTAIAGS